MGEERIPTMPQADIAEERIPTMPQGAVESERIPTMPQMDIQSERIPTMPQADAQSERIPTMPQGAMGSERVPTMPQSGVTGDRIATLPQGVVGADGRMATVPQQGPAVNGGPTGRILLTSDITFTGDKGGSFVIKASNVVSADSGESQIYGCEKRADSEKYVARVLISLTPDSDISKRQTRDKVIQFLDAMSMNPDAHVLPLVDHGTVSINGKDYYVEVYPFCEGGDLGTQKGKIPYKELCEKVIPAVNKALHYFHNAGLVHRDVKPDNLYYYKGSVVIGDFGITCDLREDGFATDRFKTGTLGYYAPELMSQAAIKASDYYSFGQTIWTLYSGEMMYRNILRRYKEFSIEEQRNQVNFSMLSNTYYGLDEIEKSDEFFEVLIRGLLQYDPSNRFDYDKVNRWLKGDRSLAHEIPDFDSSKTFTRAFPLFGKDCWDSEAVYKQLATHWDEGIEALYDGRLKDFYSSQSYEEARFFDGIMKTYSYSQNKNAIPYLNNVGLAKTILHISKNRVLCWRGAIYKDLSDISEAISACFAKGEWDNDYYGLIFSGLISEWYSNKSKCQEEIIEALGNLEEMLKKDDNGASIAYYWLGFLFAKDRDKLEIEGCKDLDAFITYITKGKGYFYGPGNRNAVVDNLRFMGLLCAWGYDDVVNFFHGQFGESYRVRCEAFIDFMSQQCSKSLKNSVNEFYYYYGPNAYLSWWKDNINLYKANGPKSKQLLQEVSGIQISKDDSIADQREAFGKLEALAQEFRKQIGENLFMGYIGLQSEDSDYILYDKIGAAWNYDFLGMRAPIGFKAFLGL